ncbi:MAG: chromosome segregation protein ScpA, partial [Candidatus Sulfotelmatobacter sp.]
MMEDRIVGPTNSAPEFAPPALVPNQSARPKPSAKPDSRKSNSQTEKEQKEESDSPFAVSVTDVYEGPLDLLLDLIRKQDIDIYDIPIA